MEKDCFTFVLSKTPEFNLLNYLLPREVITCKWWKHTLSWARFSHEGSKTICKCRILKRCKNSLPKEKILSYQEVHSVSFVSKVVLAQPGKCRLFHHCALAVCRLREKTWILGLQVLSTNNSPTRLTNLHQTPVYGAQNDGKITSYHGKLRNNIPRSILSWYKLTVFEIIRLRVFREILM